MDELGYDAGIDYRGDLAAALVKAAPNGIDLYFDNIGGNHLVAALYALKVNGRIWLAVRDDFHDGGRLASPGC